MGLNELLTVKIFLITVLVLITQVRFIVEELMCKKVKSLAKILHAYVTVQLVLVIVVIIMLQDRVVKIYSPRLIPIQHLEGQANVILRLRISRIQQKGNRNLRRRKNQQESS